MTTEHDPYREQQGADVERTARLEDPTPAAAPGQLHEDEAAPSWEATEAPGSRNPLSVAHLVAGLVFLGIAGLWLAQETGAVAVDDLDLLGPLLLVVVGAAGLLAGLTRTVRRR